MGGGITDATSGNTVEEVGHIGAGDAGQQLLTPG